MQILSLIWGIIALCGFLFGLIPCLGWFNWLNIPFAVVGLIISLVASNGARPGSNGAAKAGIVLNAIAIVIGLIRLKLGFRTVLAFPLSWGQVARGTFHLTFVFSPGRRGRRPDRLVPVSSANRD